MGVQDSILPEALVGQGLALVRLHKLEAAVLGQLHDVQVDLVLLDT